MKIIKISFDSCMMYDKRCKRVARLSKAEANFNAESHVNVLVESSQVIP